MKNYRTVVLGKGHSPVVLHLKRRRTEKTYGLGIWIVVLMMILGPFVMNRQDNLNRNTTLTQETAFRQEQARRLAALGIGPVTTEGGPAYADPH